jgi:hypothetical protein
MANEQRARFVGGPKDGEGVFTNDTDLEHPTLPPTVVADGGDRPVGYRLVPGEPNTEWQYVVDQSVADVYMEELRGVAGARAYERVLAQTGDTQLASEAARAAKEQAK